MIGFGGKILAGLGALGIVAAGVWGYRAFEQKRAVDDLVERFRADLVFVAGGRFTTGNYKVDYRLPDGREAEIWAADFEPSPRHEVALNGFYMAAYETSYADFNTYLTAQGYPALKPDPARNDYMPDRGAALSLEEAQSYCAWLGAEAGLPLRLPSEAEWEYAARARGQPVMWATDDGNFRPGENVPASGTADSRPAELHPPLGSFAPNPLGIYDLQDGLYEWTTPLAADAPSGAGIAKGGSDFSSMFHETIPRRMVAERLDEAGLAQLKSILKGSRLERLLRRKDPLSPVAGYTGVRCVAALDQPPAQSGFGRMPDGRPLEGPFYGLETGQARAPRGAKP